MKRQVIRGGSWYPLRVSDGSCRVFGHSLRDAGIQCYFNDKVFSGICFVRADNDTIDAVIEKFGDRFAIHYLWDGATFSPARIDDKRMNDFITVAEAQEPRPLCLEHVSTLLKDCHRVRVTSGRFCGIEGKLVRIKKSRRVMVDIPGDLAVATGYIRPECLEFIK